MFGMPFGPPPDDNQFPGLPSRHVSRWVLAPVIIALLLCMGMSAAFPHGSYPIECCHDRDCAPIDPRKVKATDEGWEVTLGPADHPMLAEAGFTQARTWSIPKTMARKPLSGDYHICFSPTGSLLCFFPKADGG